MSILFHDREEDAGLSTANIRPAFSPARKWRDKFLNLASSVGHLNLHMGNQRSLVRTLGLGYVIIFVIANIIGSGVYKKIAPMASELQSSVWILMVWIVGGIITLFGALSNAEVAGLLADTGGDFVYLKKIYNRFFSFLYGWSLFAVIQTATISSLAYVFTQSLNSIIPIPDIFSSLQHVTIGGIFYPFQDFGIKLTAILLIMGLTAVNIAGLKSGAGVSRVIMFLVFAGLLVIIVFGLSSGGPRPENFMDVRELTNRTVTLSSFYTAILAAFWAYQGWVSVGFIGGEVKDPTRNIPKGIAAGVLVVIAIYVIVNVTYLSLLSIPQLVNVQSPGKSDAGRSLYAQGPVNHSSLYQVFVEEVFLL